MPTHLLAPLQLGSQSIIFHAGALKKRRAFSILLRQVLQLLEQHSAFSLHIAWTLLCVLAELPQQVQHVFRLHRHTVAGVARVATSN